MFASIARFNTKFHLLVSTLSANIKLGCEAAQEARGISDKEKKVLWSSHLWLVS
jgi:hypothetical protein